jgi:hypothetical protein
MEGAGEADLLPILPYMFAKQQVLIAFWEKNNTIRNNGKGDLCPA